MTKLSGCHFLFCCYLDSLPARMQTAKSTAHEKQDVILSQMSLTIFKGGRKVPNGHSASGEKPQRIGGGEGVRIL